MSRSADYTIEGFLYQFNKTLLEVINLPEDGSVTVEGTVEDIDVCLPSGTTAIQCKYHETQSLFTLSTLYKPLLQMLHHFHDQTNLKVKYILFHHLPDNCKNPPSAITKTHLESALSSKNKELKQYTAPLHPAINLDEFLKCFKYEAGPSLHELVNNVQNALSRLGIPDVDLIAYPNALQIIADLSIQHDPALRVISKGLLIAKLRSIRTTAISRWTLASSSRKRLLDSRRKQLKAHLNINARLRYFLIHEASLEDFQEQFVVFVSDYVEKYHTKPSHVKTPAFFIDTDSDCFNSIRLRLFSKKIKLCDGFIGDHFDEAHFFREPVVSKPNKTPNREFSIRIVRWGSNETILYTHLPDDLFILGQKTYALQDLSDVNVEIIKSETLREIRYLIGIDHVHE